MRSRWDLEKEDFIENKSNNSVKAQRHSKKSYLHGESNEY